MPILIVINLTSQHNKLIGFLLFDFLIKLISFPHKFPMKLAFIFTFLFICLQFSYFIHELITKHSYSNAWIHFLRDYKWPEKTEYINSCIEGESSYHAERSVGALYQLYHKSLQVQTWEFLEKSSFTQFPKRPTMLPFFIPNYEKIQIWLPKQRSRGWNCGRTDGKFFARSNFPACFLFFYFAI